MAFLIVLGVIALFVLLLLARTVRVIPQARAGVVERLGRYSRTLTPGLTLVIPFIDRVRPLLDLREQAVSFEPQPVITQDNLVVNIDTVIYFQITDPKSATYEIANPVNAIDLLTVTTLRNVIGGMTLEQTLTSRETINDQLRGILDEATGKWGIRVHRVELKSVDPPPSIKDTMEKQMRADREKRAAILQAEGIKQSAILTAEGEKQSAILKAEGQKQSAILAAEGQSQAIATVFKAIHEGNPDPQLLAYQYLQVLPQIAQGDANKVWVIPSELTRALGGISERLLPPSSENSGYNVRAQPADDAVVAPLLKRLLNILFVIAALVVTALVVRHFAHSGWPLHSANLWLVALAAVILLGGVRREGLGLAAALPERAASGGAHARRRRRRCVGRAALRSPGAWTR